MARYVAHDATVSIDGTDLSDRVRTVVVTQTQSEVTSLAMGDEYVHRHTGAAKDGSLEIEWISDFAADEVWDTLKGLSGMSVDYVVGPNADDTDSQLGSVSGRCFVTQIPFEEASFGELSTIRTTWPTIGAPTTRLPPPKTPLWHTTLRAGDGTGTRIGFSRNGSSIIGRLTDDDYTYSGDTARIIALEYSEPDQEFFIKASQVQHLLDKWLRIDDNYARIIELSSFSTDSGEGQKTLRPDWEALTVASLYAVSVWDRDPTGTPWAANTRPHKLWSTTMTAGVSGNNYGFNPSASLGSVDDAEISTPDGDQTLSRFLWPTSDIFDVRMGTSGEAAYMHGLWFRFQTGAGTWAKTQITDNSGSSLSVSPVVSDPAWINGQAVTIEVWDQNPDN